MRLLHLGRVDIKEFITGSNILSVSVCPCVVPLNRDGSGVVVDLELEAFSIDTTHFNGIVVV